MKYFELILECMFSRATSWPWIYKKWKLKQNKKQLWKKLEEEAAVIETQQYYKNIEEVDIEILEE